MFFLVLPRKLRAKLPGREVETNCCNSKETEASNLSAHTDETESLSKVKLLFRIRVCGIGAGDEDRCDELKDEGDHIEADEEESDETSFMSLLISKVLLGLSRVD
jgi:hypothetical protein